MKRMLCFCILSIVFIFNNYLVVCAQDVDLNQLRTTFDSGERSVKFLENYWNALRPSTEADSLKSEVLNSYLLALSVDERYKVERLEDIINYVQNIEAGIFVDLVKHWDSLVVTDDLQKRLVEKIEQTFIESCFTQLTQDSEDTDYQLFLLNGLEESLKISSIPLSQYRVYSIMLWNSFVRKKINECVNNMVQLLGVEKLAWNGMYDFMILGVIANYILENCTLEQCEQMISAFDNCMVKNGLEDYTWLKDMKNCFEGKKMMIEMGEE